MLKVALSSSTRSPYALHRPSASTTTSPRRGPTGIVMLSTVACRVYSAACRPRARPPLGRVGSYPTLTLPAGGRRAGARSPRGSLARGTQGKWSLCAAACSMCTSRHGAATCSGRRRSRAGLMP